MRILKTILLSFFFLLSFNILVYSQKIQIKGGINYLQFDRHLYDINHTQTIWQLSPFVSDRYWRREERLTINFIKAYRYRFGGQIGLNISIINNKKNDLGIGLKASFYKFEANSLLTGIERELGPILEEIDGGQMNPNSDNPMDTDNGSGQNDMGFQGCNVLSNNIDFTNFRRSNEFSFTYLTLPISYEYHLIENQVSLFGEVSVSKLIQSFGIIDFVSIQSHQENDVTVCRYFPTSLEGSYRDIRTGINFGVDFGAKIWFGKFGIEASYGKFFEDVFKKNESSAIPFGQLSTRPNKFEFNLVYLLNHEKRSTANALEETTYKSKKKKRKKKPLWGAENLWFSPTGFSLKERYGKYRIINVINHSVEYGLTDNFSLTGGAMGFPNIGDIDGFLMPSIRGKLTLSASENLRFGLSSSASYIFANNADNGILLYPNLIMTYGNKENFLNLNYGYWLILDGDNDSYQVITFGGKIRLNQNWSLISDSFVAIPSKEPEHDTTWLPSLGFRRNQDKNQLDFGIYLVINTNDRTTQPIPLLSYTRFF